MTVAPQMTACAPYETDLHVVIRWMARIRKITGPLHLYVLKARGVGGAKHVASCLNIAVGVLNPCTT
jgi:hypothetical protein